MNPEKDSRLQLRVVSPSRLLVEAEVLEVQVPGLDGYLGLWPGHRPLNACLGQGQIIYRTVLNREERLDIKGGLVRVADDKILVFTGMEDDD